MYSVDVVLDKKYQNAWSNFINHLFSRTSSLPGSVNEIIDAALLSWNAISIPGDSYIKFRSKQDALLFLLRWS